MPAVSPPATASNCSKPTSRSIVVDAEIDQRPPHARKRDQPAAIGIDRACPAGGEDERLVGHEADRFDLDEHLRRQFGDHLFVGKAGHSLSSFRCVLPSERIYPTTFHSMVSPPR